MRWTSLLACTLVLPWIQACSIHPLQQDVTHLKTVQLVDRIRCEAQNALEDKIITLLEESRGSFDDPQIRNLTANRSLFRTFTAAELRPGVEQQYYHQYEHYAIAFNFTFNITEENKVSSQIDLLKTFSGGMFTVGNSNSGDFMRNNIRNFLISEEFAELLHANIEGCEGTVPAPDYIYPISGAIGLKELIDTFIDLNRNEKLVTTDKAKVFADTLMFTTTFMSSTGPKGSFVMAGRGLQVMDASLTGLAMRTDIHQVIIGLAVNDPDGKASPAKDTPSHLAAFPLAGFATPEVVSKTSATRAAAQATFDQRLNTFLDRFGDVLIRQ